jgi:hypothetical protein
VRGCLLGLHSTGGEKPAFDGTVKVTVEAHDLEAVFDSCAVLVRVVEVQIEPRRHADQRIQLLRREGNHHDTGSRHYILQKLAKHFVLLPPKQQEADGMQSEVANEKFVSFAILEKSSRFVGTLLA